MSDLRQKNLRDYSGFKVTPTGWTEKTVGEICNLGRGRVISQEEINENPGPYPVFSSQTRNNGQMGSLTTFDFFGEYITWTTDGENAGTVFFRSGQFNCTNVCGTLQPKNKDDLELQFLAYHLGRIAKRYVSYIGNPKLMNGVMASIGLILPSRNVQARIAEILSSVDRAIAHTEALIEKYQQIKAGLMHDLFTRGIGADGKLRPPRDEAPELYQESAIGWIPKEWTGLKLKEVAYKITDGDHHTPIRADKGIYLLSARNILNGKIALFDVDYVPNSEYERMIKRCHPEPEDILVSCSGTIGRVAIIPDGLKCCLVRSAALVKLDKDQILPKYAEAVLQSSKLQSQIKAAQKQAAQPNLFQGQIEDLFVPLPSMSEQTMIIRCLKPCHNKLEALESELNKLSKLKAGLMQDLLTGKVPVKVDPDEVDHISN